MSTKHDHHDHDTARVGPRASAAAALLVAGALAACAATAAAAPVSVGGGYDYSTDSKDQSTRAALAIGAASFMGADLFAAGLRFDNDAVGKGNGFSVGGGFPVAPLVQLRAMGTRFIGDADYRAWRFKTGPLLKLPTGQTLGLYYTRDESDGSPVANGVVAEGMVPLTGGLSARATAGYASTSAGDRGALGTVGATWAAARFVELSGEVGMTQNALVAAGQPLPHSRSGLGGLPIIGGGSGGSSASEATSSAVTTLLSVRVMFP